MRDFLNTVLRRFGKQALLCSLATLGVTTAVAFAFTEPSAGPTSGMVYAPLNTSGNAQTKSGSLTVSGTLQGNSVVTNGSFCLPGSNPAGGCITSWPSGGGGGQWATSGSNIYNTNSGNVGIGTSNPQENLHVNGDIFIGGNFYKGGNLSIVNTAIGVWSAEGGLLTGFNSGRVVGVGQTTGGYAGFGISNGATPLGAVYYDHNGNYLGIEGFGGRNVVVAGSSRLGIGVGNPSQKLEVAGNIKAGRFYMGDNQYGTPAPGVGTDGTNVGVTTSGLFAVVNTWGGYQPVYASDYYVASQNKWVSQLFGGGSGGGTWQTNGSTLYYNNGNVGIGTSQPSAKLDVYGGGIKASQGNITIDGGYTIYSNGRMHIHGEENLYLLNRGGVIVSRAWGGNGNLTVEGSAWVNGDVYVKGSRIADYVFEDGYNLKPLKDVETYVKQYRHLEGISPQEWKNMGVSETNAKLLEKVEELTLYSIELNNANESLKARIEALEAR